MMHTLHEFLEKTTMLKEQFAKSDINLDSGEIISLLERVEDMLDEQIAQKTIQDLTQNHEVEQ